MDLFHEITLPITEPVLIVALVLLVVLLAPLLFSRLRMPGIVGLIIAGVLIGPHTLGLLERDLTIQVLGTIGLLYIMFLAGLEVNLHEFSKYRNRSIIFGSLTFALPQGLGTLMAVYVLGFGWLQAVLLGSIFASHTLIAYPIVSRLGLAKSQAVTTAVGATIITDTAALLVLAVVARSAEGGAGAVFWVLFVALLAAYTVLLFWSLPRLGRWFFRRVRAGDTAEYVFILAAVFTFAFIAELIGVEAIIGAFLAGLALNRLVPEQSPLMSRIHFVGEALFIPFFLISVGMLVDLSVLVAGPGAWVVAISLVVTVVLTKWAAAMATGPFFGYTTDHCWMLFGLTIPQAAATLAAVLIGYDIGLFGESVLNGTILMILVTCMIGPWVAERYGRRVALQEEQASFEPSEAPQRVLVPLSNPQSEPHLVDLGILIRQAGSEEPIFPLIVARDGPNVQAQVAAGEKLLGHAVMHATAANIPVHPVTRVDFNVANGILRAIKERLISTVVIGWSARELREHFIYGSLLDQLVAGSREMMLVCKIEEPVNTCRRVVLAVPPDAERDPGFAASLQTLHVLASQLGADFLVVAEERGLPVLQERMEEVRPSVPAEYVPLTAWSSLSSALQTSIRDGDLLVLVNAREGTLVWRPTLNRLPKSLAQRFAGTSMVVLYMPVYDDGAGMRRTTAAGGSELSSAVSEERIVLGVQGSTQDEILAHLLGETLGDSPSIKTRVLHMLSRIHREYAPELHQGVIFYHAHVSGLRQSLLLAGVNREGVTIPEAPRPIHVVFILLSPEEDPPERHLRRLGAAAKLIRSERTVEQLRTAASAAEVRDILDAAEGA